MESTITRSSELRFRLRTLLIMVAVVGLLIAVVAREVHLRAELQRERARADANFQKARAAVDQLFTQVAERSDALGSENDEPRREVLEQTLKFYQGLESKASSPGERARIRDRMQQIRMKIKDKAQPENGKS
jgi:hypothetical protein